MNRITAKDLEIFLDFFKQENFDGLCQACGNFYGKGISAKDIVSYFYYHIPRSAIVRMERNLAFDAGYWWKVADKNPRIKFIESHIKALKMNPISRWFYYIYLHFTL